MKLKQLIRSDRVFLGLSAGDAAAALEQVSDLLGEQLGIPGTRIVEALQEREKLGSTGVGDGFAIPHCKLGGLSEIVVAIARFEEGFEFGSPDGAPVRLMFVVLSPPDQPASHLQVLSQIARVLKRKELRRQLLEAATVDELLEALQGAAEHEGL